VKSILKGLIGPQYEQAVVELMPILDDLPPKIIAIDGWPGVGKTTLGRFLAWRFNVMLLETDCFIERKRLPLQYRKSELKRIINKRLTMHGEGRPIIIEGIAIRRLLNELNYEPAFVIYAICESPPELGILSNEISDYDRQFCPRDSADLVITVMDASQ
jgi:Cdc6-like AAA superfamily ATPase